MNGPEHYREAERHLNLAAEDYPDGLRARYHFRKAAVHARLAQVAATVDASSASREKWTDLLAVEVKR